MKTSCFPQTFPRTLSLLALSFAVALCAPTPVRYALEFHKLGAGIRAKAMGNAYVAGEPEGTCIHWNPANLGNLKSHDVYFGHTGLYGNIANFNAGLLAVVLPSRVGVGLGYKRFEDSDINMYPNLETSIGERLREYDLRATGSPSGWMSNVQDAILVSAGKVYALEMPRLTFHSLPAPLFLGVGATFKFFRNQFRLNPGSGNPTAYYGANTNMDLAFSMQIGLQVDPKTRAIERLFGFGANLNDVLGTPVNYAYSITQYSETTDRSYVVGLCFIERTRWVRGQLMLTLDIDRQYGRVSHVGCEYAYRNVLALRAGLDSGYPTVGAGITYKYFRIDYAYAYNPLAGTPLQVGMGISF